MAILKLCFIGVVSNFTMGLFCWTYFASVSRAVSYQPIKEVMATPKQSGSIKVSGRGRWADTELTSKLPIPL